MTDWLEYPPTEESIVPLPMRRAIKRRMREKPSAMLSYALAKKMIQRVAEEQGWESFTDVYNWLRSPERPEYFPHTPQEFYGDWWKDWADFVGPDLAPPSQTRGPGFVGALSRGQQSMPSYMLPVGTILYHGTDLAYENLHNRPTFFVLNEDEAYSWAGWSNDSTPLRRVLAFEVMRAAHLLWIPDEEAEQELADLLPDVPYYGYFTGDTRAAYVCEHLNYDGYIYGLDVTSPDEIVLCRPENFLNFIGARRFQEDVNG